MIKKKEFCLSDYEENDMAFIADSLSYLSEHILSLDRTEYAVTISFDELYEKEIEEKLLKLEEMMKQEIGFDEKSILEVKTLLDCRDFEPLNKENVFVQLIEKEMIREVGIGSYAYSGVFLKVYRYFVTKIKEYWQENFNDMHKEEIEVPSLMKIEDYEKGQYFESFPHHIMFQTNIINDMETLTAFTERKIAGKDVINYTKKPQQVLRHAACAPVYGFYEDKRVNEAQTVMVSGKCFRNEEKNIFELARLNEFYMMEYVFIGCEQDMKLGINTARNLWDFWISKFKLKCTIDTANDSFFASNYRKLRLFQVLGEAKQEWKIYLPAEESYISCGSINYHRTHFTKPYNIQNDDGYCQSSCFAFGLERLTFAFLSQKGIYPERWDEDTRTEILKYVSL